jgi:hypothetical protein
MTKIDKDGLVNLYMTLGSMSVAVGGHIEDACKDFEITDLTGLDQAYCGIGDAQAGIKRFLNENGVPT